MNESKSTKNTRKIVRIIARLNVGGPARHVVWLTNALQDSNYESVLLAGRVPEGEEDMGYFADQHAVEPVFIEEMSRELSPGDLFALIKIWRKLVEEQPDVIHTHTAKAGTLGRISAFMYKWLTPSVLIGRPRKVKVIHTFHGHIFDGYYGELKTRVFLFIERMLARFATDTIVVISDQQLKEINQTYGVGKEHQFRVIPLGLDLNALVDNDESGKAVRAEFGVKEDEILMGIVGRLTEIKNHGVFIEAARTLSSDFPNIRLVIIGDGHMRQELEDLAKGTGIMFSGNRNDVAAFYSALDIVALTSLNEGTPLSLIEAMAVGKPWIATEVGGVIDLAGKLQDPDAMRHARVHERGILFDSGRKDGLIDGVRYFVEDESSRRQIGEAGQKFVKESYGKDRLIADIKALYNEA